MIGRALATAPIAVVAALLAVHTGWLSPEEPWADATGWSRIPGALRPDAELPWPDDAGERPSIGWLGHSGFLLEWHGRRLLLDPNTSARVAIARRVLERPVTAADLGRIDAALVSHAHLDHLDLPTLDAVPALASVIVPAGSEDYVASHRAGLRVIGLHVDERIRIGDLDVVAVPAAHNGSRYHPFPSERHAVGYVIRHDEAAIYFAGDTGLGIDFAAIAAAYHPRVAILPIGASVPAAIVGRYHLGPDDAVTAAERLGRPVIIPCHFGTFALAIDRPAAALPDFARIAHEHGIRWAMPRLLGAADDSVTASVHR